MPSGKGLSTASSRYVHASFLCTHPSKLIQVYKNYMLVETYIPGGFAIADTLAASHSTNLSTSLTSTPAIKSHSHQGTEVLCSKQCQQVSREAGYHAAHRHRERTEQHRPCTGDLHTEAYPGQQHRFSGAENTEEQASGPPAWPLKQVKDRYRFLRRAFLHHLT